MGIDVINYVVAGIKFNGDVLDSLNEDECDDFLSNNENVVLISPMTNSDFIYGVVLFESNDARYDDGGIPLLNIGDLVVEHEVNLFKIENELPELLKDYDEKNIGIWVFTQYG